MIEINLLPEELRRKESLKITLPDIPIKKTLLTAGAVLLSMQFLLMLAALYVKIDLASLNSQLSVLRKDNHGVLRQKAEIDGMQGRLKEIGSLTSRRFYWASMLNAITQSMTKGVWLTDISVIEKTVRPAAKDKAAKKDKLAKGQKDKEKTKEKERPTVEKFLVLEGSAIGAGQETAFIGKFLKELQANPFMTQVFADMKASNINQQRFGEYEVYGFTISCRFKKEKAP